MAEETWQRARLIPISGLGGQEEKERRATSALLAVLAAVHEFGRAFLGRLGAPAGTVTTFCEVPFELSDGRKVRADGAIVVRRGTKTWTLLVEVKTGIVELTQQQVETYLEVVRDRRYDGLLTISNQIVPTVDQHPVKVDAKRFGKLPLYHVSWARTLTTALLVKEHQGVSDPDQAWILGELIRYLEYEGSGALSFEDMGPHWPAIRNAVRVRTLRPSDQGLRETAAHWDQLVQYLSLRLAARLGREVRPLLPRAQLEDPESRIVGMIRELVGEGTLSATIKIPDAVAPLRLRADLRTMTAESSIDVSAPDLKRPSARLNWILRQLKNAPDDLRIDTAFLWGRETASDLLGNVMEDPKRFLSGTNRQPKSFSLTLSKPVGAKRKSGEGSFIGDISALVDRFYREVVQDLKPWATPAPQLPPDQAEPPSSEPDAPTMSRTPAPTADEGSLPASPRPAGDLPVSLDPAQADSGRPA